MFGSHAHELGPDSLPPTVGPRLRVEENGMIAAVPGDVDETNECAVVVAGGDPPQRVGPDPLPSACFGVAAVRQRQRDELLVRRFASPILAQLMIQPRMPG
jgi:hypothetical protein